MMSAKLSPLRRPRHSDAAGKVNREEAHRRLPSLPLKTVTLSRRLIGAADDVGKSVADDVGCNHVDSAGRPGP